MNTTRSLAAAALLACTSLLGCASHEVEVTHVVSPTQPVSSYPSYHLVVHPQGNRTSWMIEGAIHDDLRMKGYRPVDRAAADLIVTYDTDISSGDDEGVKQAIDGSIAARPATSKHLTILMTDARSGQPVWRGDAKGTVKAGHLTASVDEALEELLTPVPARGGAPPMVSAQR